MPGWNLFIPFPNLPPGDCRKGMQPDFTCSEPTSRLLSAGVHPVLQFLNPSPWDCPWGFIDCL